MNKLLVLTALLVPAIALAEGAADEDAGFRDAVTKSLTEDNRYVEAWGSANLDADPALERVALLCSAGAGDKHGYWIVEKDQTHRWELSFDVDSRTRACQKKPAETPKWEARKQKTLDVYQGHVEGWEQTCYAVRNDRLVIVRDEESSGKPGAKPKVTDWDQMVKAKKKGAVYRSSDQIRELGRR